MRLSAVFVGLVATLSCVLGQTSSVDSYIASESPIAKAGLLANIGPSGAKASGAKVSTNPRTFISVIHADCATYRRAS